MKRIEAWTVVVETESEWSAEAIATEIDAVLPDDIRLIRVELQRGGVTA